MGDRNLYQELSKLLGAPASKILPRIIELIADRQEIEIVLAAFPAATVTELSAKTGMGHGEVEERVKTLFLKGMLFISKKEGEHRYYRVKTVAQFHDSSILWKEATPEFHRLWKEYTAQEWADFGKLVEAFVPKPVIRIVPVGATIESKAKILPLEDVREIVHQANTLAVTRCTCRVVDGKCGKPLEICIQVNRAAEYALQRGTGRAITKEEAMGLLHQAEKEGLVHIVDNRQKVDHIICNCCRDCCLNWKLPNPHKFVDPSRFQAEVNIEDCLGCEVCMERCFFDAIRIEGEDPKARINPEKCVGCGLCTITCPTKAITLKEVRPPEVIPA